MIFNIHSAFHAGLNDLPLDSAITLWREKPCLPMLAMNSEVQLCWKKNPLRGGEWHTKLKWHLKHMCTIHLENSALQWNPKHVYTLDFHKSTPFYTIWQLSPRKRSIAEICCNDTTKRAIERAYYAMCVFTTIVPSSIRAWQSRSLKPERKSGSWCCRPCKQ